MTKNPSDAICSHCKMPIRIRNPSGFCDHLYYPESCEICKKADGKIREMRKGEVEEIAQIIGSSSGATQALKQAEKMKNPVFIRGKDSIWVIEAEEPKSEKGTELKRVSASFPM